MERVSKLNSNLSYKFSNISRVTHSLEDGKAWYQVAGADTWYPFSHVNETAQSSIIQRANNYGFMMNLTVPTNVTEGILYTLFTCGINSGLTDAYAVSLFNVVGNCIDTKSITLINRAGIALSYYSAFLKTNLAFNNNSDRNIVISWNHPSYVSNKDWFVDVYGRAAQLISY